MLLVKRSFRNLGKVYTAGSVITDPADIKRFKGKFAEGKIIEVTEQTYQSTAEYFKVKFGVDIPPLKESAKEVTKQVEPAKAEAPKTASKEKKVTVKTQEVSK